MGFVQHKSQMSFPTYLGMSLAGTLKRNSPFDNVTDKKSNKTIKSRKEEKSERYIERNEIELDRTRKERH